MDPRRFHYRAMRIKNSLLLALPFLAITGLSACDVPALTEGYPKVVYRERGVLATPVAPNPPPVVAGMGAAGPGAAPAAPAGAPGQVTTASIEEGQQLYGTVCFACHGQNGIGGPAGPPLNDADWINIDGSFASIVSVIQNGVMQPQQYPGAMPPRGGGNFDAQQIEALSAYVFALSQQGS
jgi:mono/diheme cytochrome c family protein